MNFINQKSFLQIKYWIYGVSIFLIIREFAALYLSILRDEPFLVDHFIFVEAAKKFIDTGNAYGIGFPTFFFVFPPIVLIFLASINEFLTPFLIFIYLLSIISFCLFFQKEPKIFIYSILISIALLEIRRASILSAMLSGNLAFYLHLAIISLWLFRNNFNTKIALYTVITIGAIIKPPIFSCYVLLPLLADGKISVSKIIPGLITMIVVTLVFILQSIMLPELFSNFMNSLDSQISSGGTKAAIDGWAFSTFWIYVSNSYVVAIFGHIITSFLIIAFWVYYKRRYLDKINNTDFVRLCISIIPVVICIIIMPRLKIYDIAIMNFLLIYLLLKIKVFEINFNFIFKSKISLLGIISISIWTIQWTLYFYRFIQPAEIFSLIIGVYFPTFLVIIITLIDRSKKIRLGTWPK